MAEPLVLLPGMMCDARLFFPQIAAESSRRSVIVAPMNCDTFAGIADDILAIAPPKFALAGLSMGGIAAMEVLRQAPERVTRLALMDTNPRAETQERQQAREPQIERVLDGNLDSVMRDEMKPNYLSEGSDRKSLLDTCMEMALALGPDVFVQQSRALQRRPDQVSTLQQVDVPTLVLCGEEDRLCNVELHQFIHGLIRGSLFEVIAGAGHLPTLEQPELTNAALARWLSIQAG